jgi:hypothetical protein
MINLTTTITILFLRFSPPLVAEDNLGYAEIQ